MTLKANVVGKIMATNDVQILIPLICEYVVLHGKGGLRM